MIAACVKSRPDLVFTAQDLVTRSCALLQVQQISRCAEFLTTPGL